MKKKTVEKNIKECRGACMFGGGPYNWAHSYCKLGPTKYGKKKQMEMHY